MCTERENPSDSMLVGLGACRLLDKQMVVASFLFCFVFNTPLYFLLVFFCACTRKSSISLARFSIRQSVSCIYTKSLRSGLPTMSPCNFLPKPGTTPALRREKVHFIYYGNNNDRLPLFNIMHTGPINQRIQPWSVRHFKKHGWQRCVVGDRVFSPFNTGVGERKFEMLKKCRRVFGLTSKKKRKNAIYWIVAT